MSSRRQRVEPVGRLAQRHFQVLPKSSVTYGMGSSRSARWPSNVTYARRADGGALAGANVAAHDRAVLAFGIDQVGIVGIDAADEAVATADTHPVLVDRAAAVEAEGRPAPRAVVLQTAGDVIRLLRAD